MIETDVQPITTEVATSDDPDPRAAAAHVVQALGTSDALYAVFVTAGYPRQELADALLPAWGDRLIGCTSAGNIGPAGFDTAPILAVAFRGGSLQAHTITLEPLSDLPAALAAAAPELDRLATSMPGRESFGLLLVDGLSMQEEYVAAALKPLLGDVPLIGGSAGDDLRFVETGVLSGGRFGPDRATLTVVTTTAPFQVFRLQHYEPSDEVMIITRATPALRLVHEINGLPAADAFAMAIDVPAGQLSPDDFSAHPVVLRAAEENWVRSISQALPDGSLQFFAAIDAGAVLRLAHSRDPELTLRNRLSRVRTDMGGITGIFAFDCILRRVEFTRTGLIPRIGSVLSEFGAIGFSTYGEQFDDFHMNQTMVGVAFGRSDGG